MHNFWQIISPALLETQRTMLLLVANELNLHSETITKWMIVALCMLRLFSTKQRQIMANLLSYYNTKIFVSWTFSPTLSANDAIMCLVIWLEWVPKLENTVDAEYRIVNWFICMFWFIIGKSFNWIKTDANIH